MKKGLHVRRSPTPPLRRSRDSSVQYFFFVCVCCYSFHFFHSLRFSVYRDLLLCSLLYVYLHMQGVDNEEGHRER